MLNPMNGRIFRGRAGWCIRIWNSPTNAEVVWSSAGQTPEETGRLYGPITMSHNSVGACVSAQVTVDGYLAWGPYSRVLELFHGTEPLQENRLFVGVVGFLEATRSETGSRTTTVPILGLSAKDAEGFAGLGLGSQLGDFVQAGTQLVGIPSPLDMVTTTRTTTDALGFDTVETLLVAPPFAETLDAGFKRVFKDSTAASWGVRPDGVRVAGEPAQFDPLVLDVTAEAGSYQPSNYEPTDYVSEALARPAERWKATLFQREIPVFQPRRAAGVDSQNMLKDVVDVPNAAQHGAFFGAPGEDVAVASAGYFIATVGLYDLVQHGLANADAQDVDYDTQGLAVDVEVEINADVIPETIPDDWMGQGLYPGAPIPDPLPDWYPIKTAEAISDDDWIKTNPQLHDTEIAAWLDSIGSPATSYPWSASAQTTVDPITHFRRFTQTSLYFLNGASYSRASAWIHQGNGTSGFTKPSNPAHTAAYLDGSHFAIEFGESTIMALEDTRRAWWVAQGHTLVTKVAGTDAEVAAWIDTQGSTSVTKLTDAPGYADSNTGYFRYQHNNLYFISGKHYLGTIDFLQQFYINPQLSSGGKKYIDDSRPSMLMAIYDARNASVKVDTAGALAAKLQARQAAWDAMTAGMGITLTWAEWLTKTPDVGTEPVAQIMATDAVYSQPVKIFGLFTIKDAQLLTPPLQAVAFRPLSDSGYIKPLYENNATLEPNYRRKLTWRFAAPTELLKQIDPTLATPYYWAVGIAYQANSKDLTAKAKVTGLSLYDKRSSGMLDLGTELPAYQKALTSPPTFQGTLHGVAAYGPLQLTGLLDTYGNSHSEYCTNTQITLSAEELKTDFQTGAPNGGT